MSNESLIVAAKAHNKRTKSTPKPAQPQAPDSLTALVELPANIEAEQATIGAMLLQPAAIEHAQRLLTPSDFHRKNHRSIFSTIVQMHTSGAVVDLITLAEALRRNHELEEVGGAAYLTALHEMCPSAANVDSYARIVFDLSVKRRAYVGAQDFAAHALNGATPDDLTGLIERLAHELAERAAVAPLRLQPITASELKRRPSISWLVAEMLPENTLSMLMAPPGMFKSFLALSVALSIANGLPWYDRATRRAPVLYISAEGSSGMGQRLRAWEEDNGPTSDDLHFLTQPLQLLEAQDVGTMISWAKRLPAPVALIVVDTLARCSAGADENSAHDMGLVIEGADRLRRETGAHVMILHHANKMGDTRGSTALPGALDTIITLKREDDFLTLKCAKQKDAAEFEPVTLLSRVVSLVDGTSSLVLDSTTERPAKSGDGLTDKERRALELLPTEGATAAEWQRTCEQKGISRATFYRCREALEFKKIVQKGGEERGAIFTRIEERSHGLKEVS